ncbi:MAG: hypothetical protein RL662_464 [Bacteroidota bacterium]|jgi:hypothetical protein
MQEHSIERLVFPKSKMSREYGSNIYITKGDKTSRIQFRTSVVYAGVFMQKYHILHLYKHHIYINGTAADDHSYRLAQECNKVFYPLIIFCTSEGNLIGLRNDTVRENWKKSKPAIQREFIGKSAEDYIRETEKNLNDDLKILNLLNKDLFFQTFFSLKYRCSTSIEVPIENKFPLVAFKNSLEAKGIQKVVQERGEANVIFEGEFTDEQLFNYGEIKGTDDYHVGKIKGNIHIDYGLDQHCRIDSIKANFLLKKENGEYLSDTRMESYYLSEYPLTSVNDEDTIQLGKEMEKELNSENEKSLWKRFQDYIIP